MPEYLAPGVYVEEIQTGPRPIEGSAPARPASSARPSAARREPTLVTSWQDYTRWFGGYIDPSPPFGHAAESLSAVCRPRLLRQWRPAALRRARDRRRRDRRGHQLDRRARRHDDPRERQGRLGQQHPHLGHAGPPPRCSRPRRHRSRSGSASRLLYYRDGVPAPFVDPTDPARAREPGPPHAGCVRGLRQSVVRSDHVELRAAR